MRLRPCGDLVVIDVSVRFVFGVSRRWQLQRAYEHSREFRTSDLTLRTERTVAVAVDETKRYCVINFVFRPMNGGIDKAHPVVLTDCHNLLAPRVSDHNETGIHQFGTLEHNNGFTRTNSFKHKRYQCCAAVQTGDAPDIRMGESQLRTLHDRVDRETRNAALGFLQPLAMLIEAEN